MRRWIPRASLLFALCLGASMGLHALGLATLEAVPPAEGPRAPTPMTVEFTFDEDGFASTEAPAPEATPLPRVAEPVETPEEAQAEPTPPTPTPPTPEARREQQPPPELRNLTAIEQESDDPSVEAPENARFLAQENRRVEQETVARDRSTRSDSARSEPPPPTPDSRENLAAEATDTPAPDGRDRPSVTERDAQRTPAPRESESAAAEPAGERPSEATPPSDLPSDPREASSASDAVTPSPTETVTFTDEDGTFTVEVPRTGSAASRAESGETRRRPPIALRLGYAQLEAAVGAGSLERAREEAREMRAAAAASSGARRQQRWEQYRFAAENFVGSVQPGNQTALNAARSPYAAWLSTVHRRIHTYFAERFLERLPNNSGALANPELYTELEFVTDADGRVLRVSITRSSGVSSFDLGAFNAVMDAQPFPSPPSEIHSGDGYVYVIWGFARDPVHACHVSQSRPFILPNPPPLVPMPGVTLTPRAPTRSTGTR